MKRFNAIFGVAALAVLPTVALAADLPSKVVAPVAPVVAPWSWNGVYVGVRGAYGFAGDDKWGIANRQHVLLNANVGQVGLRGFEFGGFAGYNWQPTNTKMVFGVEGDINASTLSRSLSVASAAPFGLPMVAKSSDSWTGALRLRAGYAMGRTLIYGAGGVAFAGNKYSGNLGPNAFVWKKNETLTGWTLGAGVDHAFTDTLFAGLEYRYTGFSKKSVWDNSHTLLTQRTPSYHSVALRVGAKF